MTATFKIGLVTVATGEYGKFLGPLFSSAAQHFVPHCDRSFFALTDAAERSIPAGVTACPVSNLTWPGPTLVRYHLLLQNAATFSNLDYLFIVDADVIFRENIGEEILSEIVAVTHYRLGGLATKVLPYERRRYSAACVGWEEGDRYFSGAFVGGKVDRFLALAHNIVKLVSEDSKRHFSAVWHDESYLNRVLIDAPPTKILPDNFLGPQLEQQENSYRAVSQQNI